jgi:putative PIN family toxin of toxin-antitoxin system
MIRTVVFDTNVLFSAVGWGGTPGRCVQRAREGKIEGVTCEEILSELAEKLNMKLRLPRGQIDEIIRSLRRFLRVEPITGQMRSGNPDPKDEMVLECAVLARAVYIVSGDKKHLLSLGHFRDILIISPTEMIRLIESEWR